MRYFTPFLLISGEAPVKSVQRRTLNLSPLPFYDKSTAIFPKVLRTSQGSPHKLQQCGQSASHNVMFPYSPVIFITAMSLRNIQLRGHISHERPLMPIIMLKTLRKLGNK